MENDVTVKAPSLVLSISPDDDPLNPRTDWDNFGTMVLFHNKYVLGDADHGISSGDFNSWQEMGDHLRKECDALVVLPIYMLDHSGITIQVGSYSCPFDSGQVGFIYCTRQQILKNWPSVRITKNLLAQAEKVLESEVSVYDQYLRGDVWGYSIETEDGEHVDSCFGYFGEDEARQEGEQMLAVWTEEFQSA